MLVAVRQDYVIELNEKRTIGEAVAAGPELVELRDATLTPAELAEAVRSVLEVVRCYRATLAVLSEPATS